MKEWLTAQELANQPGMPKYARSIKRLAAREEWVFRSRQGRGGGHEYHIDSLPEAVKTTLLRRETAPVPAVAPAILPQPAELSSEAGKSPAQALPQLKGWQRKVFAARAALYREFESLKSLHGTERGATLLVEAAAAGTLPEHLQRQVPLANARRGEHRVLSHRMILRWQRAVKQGGIEALVPKSVEVTEEPPWAAVFLACYQLPTNPSIPEAMERMAGLLPEGVAMPSYWQVSRWHNKRGRLEQERGRRTGSALQALKGYRRRDTSGLRPLDIGQCDGHSFKGYVAHPIHGRPFHPEVCAVLDCATRMAVGWSAGLAESALTVAAALRNAAEVREDKPCGGVFAILYTDGGSGNLAGINTDDETGLFARLGTTHMTGRPGNPQGRGLIERSNQSIWIRAARQLPAFTGSSMDAGARRKTYLKIQKDTRETGTSDMILSWPQFLAHCQTAVDSYNNRPHSALPKIKDSVTGLKRHMTPLECWAKHVAKGWNPEACQLSPAEIECLWLPRETRIVRRATVQLGEGHYYNPALAQLDGRKVQVAYYPTDPSRVQIWDGEGRLVCYAELDRNLTEMFPKTMVEKAAEQRAKRRAAIREQQLEEIRDERRGVVEIRPARPRPELALVVPDEARREIEAARQKLAAEMEGKEQDSEKPFTVPEGDRDMYRLWNELDRRVQAGERPEDWEERARAFYERYPLSDTFLVFRDVEERLMRANRT